MTPLVLLCLFATAFAASVPAPLTSVSYLPYTVYQPSNRADEVGPVVVQLVQDRKDGATVYKPLPAQLVSAAVQPAPPVGASVFYSSWQ